MFISSMTTERQRISYEMSSNQAPSNLHAGHIDLLSHSCASGFINFYHASERHPSIKRDSPIAESDRILSPIGGMVYNVVRAFSCEGTSVKSRWATEDVNLNDVEKLSLHHKPDDLMRKFTPVHVWVDRVNTTKESELLTVIERNRLLGGVLYFCKVDENSKLCSRLIHSENTPHGYLCQLEGGISSLNFKHVCERFEYCCSAASLRECFYTTVSLRDSWTSETSGGTPIPIRANIPGNEQSWAKNPQYLLEIETDEPRESELLLLLSQLDMQALREIFICVCYAPPFSRPQRTLEKFSKASLLKDGGASYIRRSTSVSVTARVSIPNRFVIVPSTWELGISGAFQVDCHVKTSNVRTAVKLRRLNYIEFCYHTLGIHRPFAFLDARRCGALASVSSLRYPQTTNSTMSLNSKIRSNLKSEHITH